MPKPDSWYQGWRSEIIAEYILSKYCFTTHVPVRSDVGIDLFCVLFDKEEGHNPTLNPGSLFAIQVKSNTNRITLTKNQAQYFAALDIPIVLGIVNREKKSISFISLQQMLHFRLKYGSFDKQDDFEIELSIRKEYSEKDYEENFLAIMPREGISLSQLVNDEKYNSIIKRKKKSRLIPISVGPEICNFSIENEYSPDLYKKLKDWVSGEYNDRNNIKNYIPQIPLNLSNGKSRLISYYHPKNYEKEIYPRLVPYLEMLKMHANIIQYPNGDKATINTFLEFCKKRNKQMIR